tara:strand:+ start:837 stop:3311 length:2475 start_codon:yes stop_codon:yes gene_type:complete
MAIPPLVDSGIRAEDMVADEVSVEVPVAQVEMFENGAEVIPDGEGGAIVQALAEALIGEMVEEQIPFDANLAEFLNESDMGEISNDLLASFEDDTESRDEWEETYTKGLDLLGVKTIERSEPFQGASGVTHPLISESVTQFQAQAYKELLPSGGPVKTRIAGLQNQETEAQAKRVKDYMNYLITEEMEEFDPDMDQLLFYLPLSGSTFKKVYYDTVRNRPVAKFVPAQDVVVPYSASDLATAPRITHVLKMSDNDLRKQQVMGMYRDVELSNSGDQEENPVRQKVDELQGTSKSYTDDVRTILEMHIDLDLEGFEDVDESGEPTGIKLPYIVTLDRDSSKILAIRRNYMEGDPFKQKIQYFVHYKFMPGLGFYGFGLTHMIGGLGRAATSLLRQLIDAGTLANLPAGFKARGVRVRNDDEPLQPGEWRDIDAPGGNIRDSIIPLPYKEPSGTLAQLLGALVEGGRRFVSVADNAVSNMNQEMPVGTTVAMLERGMKVMSAIHKRLHYAQKNEFRILARIIAENLPESYPYPVANADSAIKVTDFDGRVDILPVSDPNIFSMAQRVSLAQSQLQLAQSNPQMHNLHAAYRRMYQALEIQNIDEVLPPQPQPQPTDPALENALVIKGKTIQAFEGQDHNAHIMAHVAFLKTPLIMASAPAQGALYGHLQEHISLLAQEQAMQQIQQQMQQIQLLVQTGGILPEEAQMQMQQMEMQMQDPNGMARVVAQIQQTIVQQVAQMITPPPPNPAADPLVQLRMQELGLKQAELQADVQNDQNKLDIEVAKLQQQAASDAARLETQEEIADDRNAVNRERIDVQRQKMQRGG